MQAVLPTGKSLPGEGLASARVWLWGSLPGLLPVLGAFLVPSQLSGLELLFATLGVPALGGAACGVTGLGSGLQQGAPQGCGFQLQHSLFSF